MPPASGWTSRSNVSRPSRRRAKSARLSSCGVLRRGITYSAARRSLPGQLRMGVVTIGQMRCGAMIARPSGMRCKRPRHTTCTPLGTVFVLTSSASRPIRQHKSTPHGRRLSMLSGPSSKQKPSCCSVCMTPPSRSLDSNRWMSSAESSAASRSAAASPLIPPPTIATR